LVPKVFDLLDVGRCILATYEGIGAIRVTITCMVVGHVAGVVAAFSSEEGKDTSILGFISNITCPS
jgi:hypothetical protein